MASLLSGDPLTNLAFSVYENRGVFALLVGSGLSRAAGIPTGWEITLDLVRRVANAQGTENQADWNSWFLETTKSEPNYSTLVEELGLTAAGRRSILESYIEPNETDQRDGRKLPTKAHYAIAELVKSGFVKVIVTTNFDRLIEGALRERGVEPTIVASVDALDGSEPLVHSSCFLLKLHGDYKDARILNTDSELTAYPERVDDLLDRIFDEYGLIVSGWSGDWDHALRGAILRAPSRRYPMFWTYRGELSDSANELVRFRDARVIKINDADSFFGEFQQRVSTLSKTHRQDPLSLDLLVNSTKQYLSREANRIDLDDLFSNQSRLLLEKLTNADLEGGEWDGGEIGRRVKLIEAHTEPMARIAGVLGRWGNGSEFPLISDVVTTLIGFGKRVSAGLIPYVELRSYPAILTTTSYAMGLVRSERWKILHDLLTMPIPISNTPDHHRLVDELWHNTKWPSGHQSYWNLLEDMSTRKTPLSDHLFEIFKDWSGSFVGVPVDTELLFEKWEILAGIVHLEAETEERLADALKEPASQGWLYLPVGRSGWHSQMRDRILQEVSSGALKEPLLEAGFAKGDENYLSMTINNYSRLANRFLH